MDILEVKLLEWVQSQRLFDGTERILLGVSGGVDSVAMAFALYQLIAEGRMGAELVIGHINHGLRGEASDEDEVFVRTFGEALNIHVVTRRVDVTGFARQKRLSIETAGRRLRIKALAEMAKDNDCAAAATGHHADDQVETVIHRLMRGTALRGLCGIRPSTVLEGVRFIRPMLTLRREEIEAYCRENALAWREDTSNLSYAFTRNRIRHRLLPALRQDFSDATKRLTKLAEFCMAAQYRIEATADSVNCQCPVNTTVVYDRALFVKQSPWVQAELTCRAVRNLGSGLRDVTNRHYQNLMADAASEKDSKTLWPGPISVEIRQDRIYFSIPTNNEVALPSEPIELEMGKTIAFGPYTIVSSMLSRSAALSEEALRNKPVMTERLDADCIHGSLILRRLEPGDRFRPMGLGYEKKAARFLLDAKIAFEKRKKVFVLADSEKILWLAPHRLDERVKVTAKTNHVVEVIVDYRAPSRSQHIHQLGQP